MGPHSLNLPQRYPYAPWVQLWPSDGPPKWPLSPAEKLDAARKRARDALREEVGGDWREQLQEVQGIAARAQATGRMPDSELRMLAERRAGAMSGWVSAAASRWGERSGDALLSLNAELQELQGRPFAFEGERPIADQLRGFMARAVCPMWWRRQLRRAAVRARETEANAAGEVNARARQPYVTHDTAHRYAIRRAAVAQMMAATELENEAGQVSTLADLAAVSVSNKSIRRGELMTRITGCERWAEAHGMRGVFLTLTAPSRFHAALRQGGRNPRHDGSTPRDAQQWLSAQWAKARAKLQRLGLAVFGFRVAEPHHDGCPHWHGLLWADPGKLWRVVRVIKRAWLKLEGEEAGAREHRCKAVLMRSGGASGYIAKYVAKNIDDAGSIGTEGHHDSDSSFVVGDAGAGSAGASHHHVADAVGGAGPAGVGGAAHGIPEPAQADLFGGTAQRVADWASAWGIRQFQAIGQPPVTVWRELRRIAEHGGATPRMAVALEAVNRDGKRRADWAAYVMAQGGMGKGREYLLRLATLPRMKVGRYESGDVPCIVGVTDTTGPGDIQVSQRREWKPRGEWGQGPRVPRGIWAPRVAPPWTRVNNCTRTAGAADLMRGMRARSDLAAVVDEVEPGAEHHKERHGKLLSTGGPGDERSRRLQHYLSARRRA